MTNVEVKAGRREWLGLAVLVLPCLLVSMDVSILFIATPHISEAINPSATQQLWILDGYTFALSGALISMGALGDRIGRRRLLMIGAMVFGAVSLAAAYSGSAEMLIASRAVLGLAGATLMPSTLALIRNMFHNETERKSAIGIWTSSLTGGVILGPIVAGLLLNHFWWGSVFLINIPVMVVLLIVAPMLLPEYRAPRRGQFDVFSAVLSLVSVVAVIYGVKQVAVEGFALVPVVAIVLGLILGGMFLRRQMTYSAPLIDVHLFRSRAFSFSVATKVVTGFGLTGIGLYTNQYMQLVLGMRPLESALWSLLVTPAVMIGMFTSLALAPKVRPAVILSTGMIVMALGFAVLFVLRPDSGLWLVLSGSGLVAAGMMVTAPLIADLVLTAAPPERAGAASALAETSDEFGSALGVAILGTIGASVYHNLMNDVPVPGASAAAVDAVQGTLGGAVAVSQQLPADVSAGLMEAARNAFTDGLNYAAIAAIVVCLGFALTTIFALRKVPVSAKPAEEPSKA